MSDELTQQQTSTLRFRREVADRFGVLPNFFCSADAAPGLVEELWKFAKSAYLDSPLPSLFKERLFVHLSRFCEVRYCIVRHVGFLIGQGRPAGDADAASETVEQVIEMLRRPLPEGPAFTKVLERLERVSLDGRLPEPRTECETDLFDALTIMFLSPRDAAHARAAVRAAVGDATFELLVAYLAFIRTAHYWTEMHPELTYEPDMAEILRGYGELAALLLDTSEAELVQGGVRLRETLNHLKRVEVALQESESRHAFLLRLGDALRLLIDPMAIQGEASRLLGERLLTDRAYYADIDEAQGYILVERNFVRAGVSSMVGRYSLSDFNWVGPTFRMGGPVVVADTRTSPLIPDADRPAVAAVGVGAFVAAPLIRDGRLVAALCVSDLSPRAWTPEEVELVKETAERTWEAIERARAEEQLREANARKDEFLAMLAHELRNPLAPIRTGLELIRRGGDTVVAVERVRGMMERQVGHMVRLIDDLLDVSRITSGKIVLQREPTLLGESGPQRRGSQSCRHGCQTNRIERRAATGRLRHRCGSDTVRSDPVKPAPQRGEIHERRRLGVHLRDDHAAGERCHTAGVDFGGRFRNRDLAGVAASCVRSLHARRDALLATWTGHWPRARTPAGGTSRRTSRRPQ